MHAWPLSTALASGSAVQFLLLLQYYHLSLSFSLHSSPPSLCSMALYGGLKLMIAAQQHVQQLAIRSNPKKRDGSRSLCLQVLLGGGTHSSTPKMDLAMRVLLTISFLWWANYGWYPIINSPANIFNTHSVPIHTIHLRSVSIHFLTIQLKYRVQQI